MFVINWYPNFVEYSCHSHAIDITSFLNTHYFITSEFYNALIMLMIWLAGASWSIYMFHEQGVIFHSVKTMTVCYKSNGAL